MGAQESWADLVGMLKHAWRARKPRESSHGSACRAGVRDRAYPAALRAGGCGRVARAALHSGQDVSLVDRDTDVRTYCGLLARVEQDSECFNGRM